MEPGELSRTEGVPDRPVINPGPSSSERLKNAPGNASARLLVTATQKLSPDLQISKDEAKRFSAATEAGGGGVIPPAVVVLSGQMCIRDERKALVSSGMAAQPPYDHAGRRVRASEEVNGLLRDRRERFGSSSQDCLEPRLLDVALVRCQPSFTGNFLMWMITAL